MATQSKQHPIHKGASKAVKAVHPCDLMAKRFHVALFAAFATAGYQSPSLHSIKPMTTSGETRDFAEGYFQYGKGLTLHAFLYRIYLAGEGYQTPKVSHGEIYPQCLYMKVSQAPATPGYESRNGMLEDDAPVSLGEGSLECLHCRGTLSIAATGLARLAILKTMPDAERFDTHLGYLLNAVDTNTLPADYQFEPGWFDFMIEGGKAMKGGK